MDEDILWYHLGVCRGMDIKWFYEDYESDPVFAANMDSICLSCPVRAACLREGVENQEYGLWGGVFLINGKADPTRNQHKTEEVWDIIKNGVTDE